MEKRERERYTSRVAVADADAVVSKTPNTTNNDIIYNNRQIYNKPNYHVQ